MTLKKTVIDVLCHRAAQTAINPFLSNNAVVFMLHRFASEKFSTTGHEPAFLRQCLDYIGLTKRNVISLDDLFLSLTGQADPVENAVVFTIDDGFLDQGEIGAQVFCEYGLPVTICLVTELVSNNYWLAESRLAYVLETTAVRAIDISFAERRFNFDLNTPQQQQAARRELIYFCKSLTLDEAEQFISTASERLEISVPEQPPLKFRGMDWNYVKELESKGVSFCAHTQTHPSLSIETGERSRLEISGSLERLQQNTKQPSQVFCYPTGRPAVDFTAREERYAREAGCLGAVSAVPGYVNVRHSRNVNLFSVPRYCFPTNMQDFKQIIHHLEILKETLRGGMAVGGK